MVLNAALFASIFSACVAAVIWYQYATRRKPYQLAWAISFTLFAAASIAEWIGRGWGWSEGLARTYYLGGAILVTGYLALGAIWLLWPGTVARVATLLVVIGSALAIYSITQAPVAAEALAEEGWRALEVPPLARVIRNVFNIGGTLLLVGGTLASWWSMRDRPQLRNRARGILTITVGVLVVAMGGGMASRFGASDGLIAVTNAIGSAIILAGVLWADRRPTTPSPSSAARA